MFHNSELVGELHAELALVRANLLHKEDRIIEMIVHKSELADFMPNWH